VFVSAWKSGNKTDAFEMQQEITDSLRAMKEMIENNSHQARM